MEAVVVEPNEAADCEIKISDHDRDALHILPIAILPVQHRALKRARLIKNARLDSMIEMFHGAGMGSGQITVPGATKLLGLKTEDEDVKLLRKVMDLTSYDVYSLRILLRDCEINLPDASALKLSATKMEQLSTYMTKFTRPLVAEIFGADATVQPFSDIVGLLRHCGQEHVRTPLAAISARLGIGTTEIPKFLEDYADIFMSLSYYRECLDQLLPPIQEFLQSVTDIRSNYQLKQDANLMRGLDVMEKTINGLLANVTGRIESFERGTNDMWRNLTAERFRKIEKSIRSYHTTIGGALCALSVKMNAWVRLFPPSAPGGPLRRAEFMLSDMRQGIDRIRTLENSAPMLSVLDS